MIALRPGLMRDEPSHVTKPSLRPDLWPNRSVGKLSGQAPCSPIAEL